MPQISDLPTETESQRIVRTICEEAYGAMKNWRVSLVESARWNSLKSEPFELQISVLFEALVVTQNASTFWQGNATQVAEIQKSISVQLLKRDLPFSSEHLVALLEAWLSQKRSLDFGVPGNAILSAVERFAEKQTLGPQLVTLLKKLRNRALKPDRYHLKLTRFKVALSERLAKILDEPAPESRKLPDGAFGLTFSDWINSLDETKQTKWFKLARYAAEATNKSKPAAKWLNEASPLIEAVGHEDVSATIKGLLAETIPDPQIQDYSLDILKGLIWLITQLDHSEFSGEMGRFIEKCFHKIPGVGARSVMLGNAALWTLSEMANEPRAGAELFRLREKIKYPSARKIIDARLASLSQKKGQSVEEIEDASMPTFGLDANSTRVFTFPKASARVVVTALKAEIEWFSDSGTPLKNAPTNVRSDCKHELAELKKVYKDIENARASQIARLEQSWLENRTWSYENWKKNFVDHPLRRPIVEVLIWDVDGQQLLLKSSGAPDLINSEINIDPNAEVKLWHPLNSDIQEVLDWRRKIVDLEITQPFKQAHREIYVLTDAERTTGIYSNRFAAHILRQHQFKAICNARGWTYNLMGHWDGLNVPTKQLPKLGLSVEYSVDIVDDRNHSEAFVSMHVSTDQVRFLGQDRQPIELVNLDPIVFSEIMRDVDLFVAVTSVANDPNWADGGPNGTFAGYWTEWAFGELGQSASVRRDLIKAIAPKLSIASKLEITDKFLVVQGKRQKYAIHFGSSNIQILPSNRYLCIVPDRADRETEGLKLPFAGDSLFSTILAKAFMLSDESQIVDPSILSQL